MSKHRTPGWVGAAAARADEILERCRLRKRATVDDVETLRDSVFAVADEVLRLQRVVEQKDARIAELGHTNRPTPALKTWSAAS
ncbi:hypothetical protein [Embleya sp. NPDC005971]|uniref:hypothetical protein n=1 Tax=Embleya sp. NPDC005971 TaxID=3156724 RepID=UPI0033C906F2